jgi:hypothetical protein
MPAVCREEEEEVCAVVHLGQDPAQLYQLSLHLAHHTHRLPAFIKQMSLKKRGNSQVCRFPGMKILYNSLVYIELNYILTGQRRS